MFTGPIARTPIYTRTLDVFGYELKIGSDSGDEHTVDHLVEASREIPLEALTGAHPALIRLPAPNLARCEELQWPKDRMVLAISAPRLGDREESERIAHLVAGGYTVALHSHSPDTLATASDIAELFRIYTLDAAAAGQFPALPPNLAVKGRRTMMVRELENGSQYEQFVKLGFDYYEGTFFERPRLLHGTEIPGDRIAVLQLIARLQDPKVGIDEVERLVSRDLTLSYKLLRLLNAAYFGLPKRVESIRRAVVFFGLERIKNWATVLLVNAMDFRPRELLMIALVRARACQLLAEDLGFQSTEAYYIIGLFSLLDAIMDAPMAQILDRLNLSEHISSALMGGSGSHGEVLRAVLAYERGDASGWRHLTFSNSEIPIRSYLDGIRWATEFGRQIENHRT